MILLPPSRYPPLVNVGESALPLYTPLCSDVVTWAIAIILVYQMYSAVEVTGSTLLVIDHAAKIIETMVTYPQFLVALSATRWPERFGYTRAAITLSHFLHFLQYYGRQQVGATMLSTKYKIHEPNLNSIGMNSGGMPLYV